MLRSLIAVAELTARYWLGLWRFLRGDRYADVAVFGDDTWAKAQVYSLSLVFTMWGLPHYRSADFRQDMIDNLRNVAIPGTGVPLSVFCYNYYVCLFFIFFINPLVCLCGAANKCRKGSLSGYAEPLSVYYETHLLRPDDWFSFWRMNCRLTSAQSMVTQSSGFAFENKWKFLLDGHKAGVPVSPFFEVEQLVCKHMNIEGGMGIHFYKNALHGGDWILQERLGNCEWLSRLLPEAAPLSTMRIITSSTHPLSKGAGPLNDAEQLSVPSEALGKLAQRHISPLTAVLRLGRANAATDHSSVLFDVDMATGRIGNGLDNSHWYKLGLRNARTCPWLPNQKTHTKHPDPPYVQVLGQVVPDIKLAVDICVQSHYKLMKDVPMVGWDVAFTTKGLFLLEVNLSCNFFKGTFNIPRYIKFVDSYWNDIDIKIKSRSDKDKGL